MASNLITKARPTCSCKTETYLRNASQKPFPNKSFDKIPTNPGFRTPLALPFTTLFTRPIKIHLQDSFLGTVPPFACVKFSHIHEDVRTQDTGQRVSGIGDRSWANLKVERKLPLTVNKSKWPLIMLLGKFHGQHEKRKTKTERLRKLSNQPVVLSNHSTKTHQSVQRNHTQNNLAGAEAIKSFYVHTPKGKITLKQKLASGSALYTECN